MRRYQTFLEDHIQELHRLLPAIEANILVINRQKSSPLLHHHHHHHHHHRSAQSLIMSAKLSHEPQVVLTVHDPNQTGWVSSSGVETGQEGKTLPDPHHGCGPPPDGGLRAWLVAAGGFAIFFPTLGFSNSFGVMAQYYLEHQLHEKSTDDIAWIGSLSVFLSFFAGMLGGPLFDRFGSKVRSPW